MRKLFFLGFLFFASLHLYSQDKHHEFDAAHIDKFITQNPNEYFKLVSNFKNLSTAVLKKLSNRNDTKENAIVKIFALNQLGDFYRKTNNFDKSIDLHIKSVGFSKKYNLTDAKIHSLNCLGSAYNSNGDLKNALENHQKALKIASEITKPSKKVQLSIGQSLNKVGLIYSELRQYQLAIEQFKGAIKTYDSIDNTQGLAENYLNLGCTYHKINDLDKSLQNYSKSLRQNKIMNSKKGEILSNINIADIHILKKNFTKAKFILDKVKNEFKLFPDELLQAKHLMILGFLNLKQKNFSDSENYFLKSLEKYNRIKRKNSDYVVLNSHISNLYDLMGKKGKALYFYKRAHTVEEELFHDRRTLYVGNLISKYDLQSKRIKIDKLESLAKMQIYEASINKNILIIILISLALLSVALYSVYRQRLLNNDKKVLTLEQQALQSQMNPHFIFNALNSIKLYIINNEQKEAVYYLNKFSKLIRNILDVSKNKYVSLKEELETMNLYVRIENIRFNNEIEFVNKIDEGLSLDTIKIPPLILQPFLENAIWHGLSSKNGKKEIVLSVFKVSKNILEISITDSGIGRDAAMKINSEKSLNRKSVGIGLTKERLKTFANEYIHDFSLKYYDLKEEDGTPRGTKVVLRIPLF